MQIAIVVDDKLVLVNSKPLELSELDWSVFDMDPNDPNDDVAAVQFDTDTGMGHVEFKTRLTKQLNRPNNRPPDWFISAADFEKHFGFVLPAYEAKLKKLQAELAAKEAQREATREARANDPAPPVAPVDAVSREEAQRMSEDAATKAVAAFAAEIVKPSGG